MSWFVTAVTAITVGGVVYNSEKQAKAARAEQARQGRLNDAKVAREAEYGLTAKAYNDKVDSFNTGLTDTVSGLGGYGRDVSALGIADLYDDPTTSANENKSVGLFDNLNTLEGTLEGLSFDENRPTFSNTLTTADGTIALDNLPTLGTANTAGIGNYLDDIDTLQTSIGNLRRDRRSEEGRITDFQNDLNFDMGQLGRNIGRLDISQSDQLDRYEDTLSGYQDSYNNFSSDILGQVGGLSYDDSAIKESIGNLRTGRTNEQTRIDNFSDLLGGFNADYSNALSTGQLDVPISSQDNSSTTTPVALEAGFGSSQNEALNIEDIDQLNTLQRLIDTQQDRAANFDSLLDFDFSSELRGLGETEGSIGDILRDRTTELSRIETAQNQALKNANSLNRFSSGLGIADIESMNDLGFDIEDFNAGVNNFESRLDFDFSPATGVADTAQATLNDLIRDRGLEQTRISEYGDTLGGFATQYGDDLGGYNIANIEEMDALQDAIDAQQQGASRFSSELDFDFGNQLDDLGGVERDLGQLYLDRSIEQGRISDAERDYGRLATSIDRLADTQGIYSLSGIDELQGELDELNTGINDFESLLDFDFSGTDEARGQAQTDLTGLYDTRRDELDAILNPIAGISSGAAGLELYDETGMRDARGELSDLDFDLARFSGGRVGEIQTGIDGGIGAIDTRLGELEDYRGTLETNAQGLLDSVTDNSYYRLDDLTGDLGLYDTQFEEADLYNANIAMDELDSIQKRLYGERNRLEQDAANVASRRTSDQESLAAGLNEFGIPQFDNLSQVDPRSIAEYMAMLDEEEEEEFTLNPNAFSSNVLKLG
jgi:hypothetical protein